MRLVQFCVPRYQKAPGRVCALGGHGIRTIVAWLPFDVIEADLGRAVGDHEDAIGVVQSNLDLVERITERRYARGECSPHARVGQQAVLVNITREDIGATGERLRDPLKMALSAHVAGSRAAMKWELSSSRR